MQDSVVAYRRADGTGDEADLAVVVPSPPAQTTVMGKIVAFVGPSPRRPDPVLLFDDPRQVPDGAFMAKAIANGCLHVEQLPAKGSSWEEVEEFALTYDGYSYWRGLAELATRVRQTWTRDGSLPADLDELRACLFSEQRRWHHFGEEPLGRAARYVADLLHAITAAVATGQAVADIPVSVAAAG